MIFKPRVKHDKTCEQQLAEEAAQFNLLDDRTPPGMQRELYLRRARQAETAARVSEWLKAPGLRPPR
jgi:hypothetical protein